MSRRAKPRLFTAVATYVLFKTRIGNWIFAVGGDQESARAVGVPVTAVKVGLFMFVGFCAWFAGMHLLFAFNTVQSGQGVGNEFIYIIAAVIGFQQWHKAGETRLIVNWPLNERDGGAIEADRLTALSGPP